MSIMPIYNGYRGVAYAGPTVSRSFGNNSSSTPVTLTVSPAPTSGKVLLLMIECDGDIISLPSGFTEILSVGSTFCQFAYKVCGGSEPTSYSIVWDDAGPTGLAAAMIEITGANATPIDVSAASLSTLTSPSVTTTGANRLIVTAGGGGSGVLTVQPTGFNLDKRQSGSGNCAAIASKGQVASGATGTLVWTTGTPDRVYTVAIKA